jgi:hypothetical protein
MLWMFLFGVIVGTLVGVFVVSTLEANNLQEIRNNSDTPKI